MISRRSLTRRKMRSRSMKPYWNIFVQNDGIRVTALIFCWADQALLYNSNLIISIYYRILIFCSQHHLSFEHFSIVMFSSSSTLSVINVEIFIQTIEIVWARRRDIIQTIWHSVDDSNLTIHLRIEIRINFKIMLRLLRFSKTVELI